MVVAVYLCPFLCQSFMTCGFTWGIINKWIFRSYLKFIGCYRFWIITFTVGSFYSSVQVGSNYSFLLNAFGKYCKRPDIFGGIFNLWQPYFFLFLNYTHLLIGSTHASEVLFLNYIILWKTKEYDNIISF